MLRKLIVFALLLVVVLPVVAQVEFHVDLVDTYEDAVLDFHGLNPQFSNTAEYMFLTNQEADYCSGKLHFSDAKEYNIQLCYFEDPVTEELFLYTYSECCNPVYLLYFETELIGRLFNGGGIAHPPPGEYEVHITHRSRSDGESLFVKAEISLTLRPESKAGEVEFKQNVVDDEDIFDPGYLSSDQRTIAQYLYRTQREQHCTDDYVIPTKPNVFCFNECEARICIYEDYETGASFLITSSVRVGYSFSHNDAFMTYLSGGSGVPDLVPGQYEVILFGGDHNNSRYDPMLRFGTVSFTIPDTENTSD